jgi:hypothetical protein
LEEIVNGVVLGNRIGVSVLVEGALRWAIFADWVKVAKDGKQGQKPKEMKKVNLKGPFVPFVSLFATRV